MLATKDGIDLLALMQEAAEKGEAVIPSTETAKFFKLQLELK